MTVFFATARVFEFLPLLRALVLLAEDTKQPGEKKLQAVLDGFIDALHTAGVILPSQQESVRRAAAMLTRGLVTLWNALGWPTVESNTEI